MLLQAYTQVHDSITPNIYYFFKYQLEGMCVLLDCKIVYKKWCTQEFISNVQNVKCFKFKMILYAIIREKNPLTF